MIMKVWQRTKSGKRHRRKLRHYASKKPGRAMRRQRLDARARDARWLARYSEGDEWAV